MLPDFELVVTTDGDHTIVAIWGELDIATAPVLRDRLFSLLSGGSTHLVLDLAGMTFIDSRGLGAFIGAARDVRAAGGELDLVHPRPAVRRVIEISGMSQALLVDKAGAL